MKLFEAQKTPMQFANLMATRLLTFRHLTKKAFYSLIKQMVGNRVGAGHDENEMAGDYEPFIMVSSVSDTDRKTSRKEEIDIYAREVYNCLRKIFYKYPKKFGPEVRTAVSEKVIINGFLTAYGYEVLEERKLNTMNRKPPKSLRENRHFIRKLAESSFDGIADDGFEELYSDVEGHSDWTPDMDDDLSLNGVFDEDGFYDEEGGSYEASADAADFLVAHGYNEEYVFGEMNDHDIVHEAMDLGWNLKESTSPDTEFERLYEGGHRKNMSQETIDAFVHQLLLIPDASRRQEVVDEIFKKIAEENTKAYEKSQSKLQTAETEVKDELKESHVLSGLSGINAVGGFKAIRHIKDLIDDGYSDESIISDFMRDYPQRDPRIMKKILRDIHRQMGSLQEVQLREMITECQECGKVFDSHDEGHIVNDGVVHDYVLCDKCYEHYTDYN